jgi:hypothetical protein
MGNGVIHVYRRHPDSLGPTQFVFAITDNWKATGRPVEWGLVPLITKLKACDLTRNPLLFENLIADYEKDEANKEKERMNSFEAMAYELAPAFKKDFAYINTSSMDKSARTTSQKRKNYHG